MTYKAPKVTTNILNISKLTENHLITKKKHNFYPIRQAPHTLALLDEF